MTKEEYQDFSLRYKGCGACFPLYEKLTRFEKIWFAAIQKDVTSLEQEKCELLGIIQGKDKAIKDLEEENAGLKGRMNAINLLTPELEKQSKIKKQQLTKAKEIIRDFLSVAIDYIDKEDKNYSFISEAEQFLNNEVEK